MPEPIGRKLALSPPRRIMGDVLHFARKAPTVPVQRRLKVDRVAEAREQISPSPGWCAIFTKAYALVAQEFPELRRAYLGSVRPCLYEHPISIASVAIEREYQGERGVFFAHVREPNARPLMEIEQHLRKCKSEPIESIGLFRRAIKIGRLPWPLRRLAWRIGLNASGHKRAKRLGTFAVSVYSGLGAESLHPLSPLTTTINYGVIQENGEVDFRIIYDHRVMDGATVARALAHLQDVLDCDIRNELQRAARGVAA